MRIGTRGANVIRGTKRLAHARDSGAARPVVAHACRTLTAVGR